MDFSSMTNAEVAALHRDVTAEHRRRQAIALAPARISAVGRQVLAAEGVSMGDPWRQPTGAHDGKTWLSLTPANVWEPGISGWREEVTEAGPAAWVQPTGAHDAYQIGDRVLFEGATYESLIDTNTWSPTDYPAGWSKIT